MHLERLLFIIVYVYNVDYVMGYVCIYRTSLEVSILLAINTAMCFFLYSSWLNIIIDTWLWWIASADPQQHSALADGIVDIN